MSLSRPSPGDRRTVAQVSELAVSPTSRSARSELSRAPRAWKAPVRQLGKPAPRTGFADVSDLAAAKRFLFLQYETALGTAVHATPVFEALRKAIPDAVITVFCNGLPYEVLKYNPNIDSVLRTPHPVKQWPRSLLFFASKAWTSRKLYDCVITDSGNRTTRFAVLALLTAVRRRIGFKTRLPLNHISLEYDLDESVLANNLRLIDALGHPCDSIEPAVFFSQREAAYVNAMLFELGISRDRPLVAFQTQTSGGEPNQWYDQRFIELADRFYQTTRAQLLFVGAKSERDRIERIRSAMSSPSCSAAGRTDIPALAALLSNCDLLITLDTGTMHVGRAVNVPMVVIAPAKNPLHEWLPSERESVRVIIRKDIACACCRKTFCATRECMDEIHPTEVLEATIAQLQRFPASPAARQNRLSQRLRQIDAAQVSQPAVSQTSSLSAATSFESVARLSASGDRTYTSL